MVEPKLIDEIAEYMLAARGVALPPDVVQKGKSHILDTFAATVSGSTLKPGKLGLAHARAGWQAGVFGTRVRSQDDADTRRFRQRYVSARGRNGRFQ